MLFATCAARSLRLRHLRDPYARQRTPPTSPAIAPGAQPGWLWPQGRWQASANSRPSAPAVQTRARASETPGEMQDPVGKQRARVVRIARGPSPTLSKSARPPHLPHRPRATEIAAILLVPGFLARRPLSFLAGELP